MLNTKRLITALLVLSILSSINGFGKSIALSGGKNIEKGYLLEKKSTLPNNPCHSFALNAVFQSSIRLNADHNLNLSSFNNYKKSSNNNVSWRMTVDTKSFFVYYFLKRDTDIVSLPLYIMYHRLAI